MYKSWIPCPWCSKDDEPIYLARERTDGWLATDHQPRYVKTMEGAREAKHLPTVVVDGHRMLLYELLGRKLPEYVRRRRGDGTPFDVLQRLTDDPSPVKAVSFWVQEDGQRYDERHPTKKEPRQRGSLLMPIPSVIGCFRCHKHTIVEYDEQALTVRAITLISIAKGSATC